MPETTNLCDHCLFSYPACIGTPRFTTVIGYHQSELLMSKIVANCDCFIESTESINENQ